MNLFSQVWTRDWKKIKEHVYSRHQDNHMDTAGYGWFQTCGLAADQPAGSAAGRNRLEDQPAERSLIPSSWSEKCARARACGDSASHPITETPNTMHAVGMEPMPRNTSLSSRSLGWPLGCRQCWQGATSPWNSRAQWPVAVQSRLNKYDVADKHHSEAESYQMSSKNEAAAGLAFERN